MLGLLKHLTAIIAMPLGILLAVLSAALAWGWAAEAALFGLAWAGLLRPGEVLSARRIDLILPRDAAPGTKHALLVIRNPKTRGRAARHQSARVDPADVIELLDAVFGKLPGHALLWPQSGATLRRRLEQIQERLGLVEAGKPAFDLSSFRPGGATWALNATENSELVRRRGRWLSLRVMDIYLQEVVAITFLPSLEPSTRECVDSLASQFTAILQRVIFFMSRGIPRARLVCSSSASSLSNCWKMVGGLKVSASAMDGLDLYSGDLAFPQPLLCGLPVATGSLLAMPRAAMQPYNKTLPWLARKRVLNVAA